MAPTYLFGDLSRVDAEAEVEKAGLEDGNFMVRSRAAGKPGYVLCVVYKGKPTHHLMVPNEEGLITVNKKTYGGAKTLEQIIEVLRKPARGWPVPLKKSPVNPANAPKKKASVKKKGSVRKSSVKGKGPAWLHDKISKADANELLTQGGVKEGAFLVRKHATEKNQFVLGLVYKGKPTHHLIKRTAESGQVYVINNKKHGEFDKVSKLVAHLRKPGIKGWPAQLLHPVVKEGAEEVAPAVPTSKKPTPPVEQAAAEEPATMETKPIAPAAAAPAPTDGNLSRDVQRVLVRAVVGMGTKINAYEAQLAQMNTQLEQLEAFALAVQQAVVQGTPRPTFESLQQSLYGGGGGHGGATML